MAVSESHDKQIHFLGLGPLFCIYLVWQLPNVITLRYFLLLGLFILFVPAGVRGIYRTLTTAASEPSSKPVFIAYALFIAWLFFIAIGIAAEPYQSLMEIKGQWLPPTLCLLIGYGSALTYCSRQTSAYSPVRIAYWALLAHAVLQLVVAAWTIYYDGRLPFGNFGGISDHKANVTYTNALAFSLLLANIVRTSSGDRLLRLGRGAQAIMATILFTSTYVSATRNGLIVLLLMTLAGGLVIALRRRQSMSWKWEASLAICLGILIAGAWLGIKTDARWERFIATVPVGWDIDSSQAWVNTQKTPAPPAADGGPVDLSAYERVAYVHAALRFVAENPLGREVSRDAFKRLISLKYSYALAGHPHNSYLDLAISIGLPGLALWLAFLGTMIWVGYRWFRYQQNAVGLALLLVVFSFAVRSLLDSIVRDHIIQEFMLTFGLLLGCLTGARSPEKEKVVVPN